MPTFQSPTSYAKSAICIALICTSHSAIAGNLTDPTVEAPVEATETLSQIDNRGYWEGAYVGATIGYNFSGGDRIGLSPIAGSNFSIGKFENSGWAGSLRAGYRWQLDHWVFGPEIAIEGGKVEDAITSDGYTGSTKLNHAYSLRLKAGRTIPVFNSIVYGTIGLTRGDFDYTVVGSGSFGPVNIDTNFAANGYILGFGIEQPLTKRLSLTGEYEYVNYGKTDLTGSQGDTTIATPLFHNVKVGLNLRF